jgi:NAD(P)-dependent dehydrogenase (short-subunit alcohol dehydrogenase family)
MAHRNRLANAHVLVFGGTSGIGFAIANMALSYGARVTISGSGQPKVDMKVEKLRSYFPQTAKSNVQGFACDLRNDAKLEANLKTVLDSATEDGTKIDHIAFTAGDIITLPKVQDFTVDNLLAGFTVRTIAPAILAKLIAGGDYMPKSADSSISLTGATNTHRPPLNWTAGALIGSATEGLSRGLAVDMAPIRVNIVNPGAIHTELFQGLLDRNSPESVESMKRTFSLLGEFGRPEDIAEAYGWLMRDRFANGGLVSSDGGRLLVGTGK